MPKWPSHGKSKARGTENLGGWTPSVLPWPLDNTASLLIRTNKILLPLNLDHHVCQRHCSVAFAKTQLKILLVCLIKYMRFWSNLERMREIFSFYWLLLARRKITFFFLRQIILKSWKSNYKWKGAKWYASMSELWLLELILYYMRGKTENFEEM